jgi:hypothetical protein
MGLVELLDQIRDDFVGQLLAIIDAKRSQPEFRVIAEPALRRENGSLAVEGDLQLPARTDVAILEGDALNEMFDVKSESLVAFDPVEFDWGKTLHVEMGPFAWQGFTITFPDDESYNWAPIQDWYWKWFQEEADDPEPPALLGAVHGFAGPAVQDDVVECSVDLGSAPIAAFEELLDALSISGVSLCAVGQVMGASSDE